MTREDKPIRVFYSDLSQRFFATKHWQVREEADGVEYILITGKKYDVTNDIASAIVKGDIVFTESPKDGDQ